MIDIKKKIDYETEPEPEYNYMERYKLKDINDVLTSLMNEYKYNSDTIDKAKLCKLSYY